MAKADDFNPRAPYGARQDRDTKDIDNRFISIHAPHTGRDGEYHFYMGKNYYISIHAPHTGRDGSSSIQIRHRRNFNPRAPYGARPFKTIKHFRPIRFQSTRPIRGATLEVYFYQSLFYHFNPRAPYGARQQKCIIYVLHFCNNRQSKHKNQQETSSVRTFF